MAEQLQASLKEKTFEEIQKSKFEIFEYYIRNL